MLLFLDQENDAHADWVEAECHRRGILYYRLCTEKIPQEVQLSLKVVEGQIEGFIRSHGQEIALRDVTGIWHRRPGRITPHPDLDELYHPFARKQVSEMLFGLYGALWDRRWVNPPYHEFAVEHKIYQFRYAHYQGFKTAPSIVTTDPEEAVAFFQACGENMIYKPLWPEPIIKEDGQYGIYTTLVTKDNLEENLDSIGLIPCLFQKFIPKQYELRVNVIGKYVWPVAIYTQEMEHTQIDFRPFIDECKVAPVLLPLEVERACRNITYSSGLRTGMIDLIYTPEGEYVFLEINPSGQWAWVEDMVGFPLCTALVDELLGIDTLAGHPYIKHQSLHFVANTAIKQLPQTF